MRREGRHRLSQDVALLLQVRYFPTQPLQFLAKMLCRDCLLTRLRLPVKRPNPAIQRILADAQRPSRLGKLALGLHRQLHRRFLELSGVTLCFLSLAHLSTRPLRRSMISLEVACQGESSQVTGYEAALQGFTQHFRRVPASVRESLTYGVLPNRTFRASTEVVDFRSLLQPSVPKAFSLQAPQSGRGCLGSAPDHLLAVGMPNTLASVLGLPRSNHTFDLVSFLHLAHAITLECSVWLHCPADSGR